MGSLWACFRFSMDANVFLFSEKTPTDYVVITANSTVTDDLCVRDAPAIFT